MSLGFRSDQVGKLSSVRVRRAWDLEGAMLRAPARGGGCKGTASAPCTRLLCWTQGRAGRPNLRPCGTGAQDCTGQPRVSLTPGLGWHSRSGPDQMVASPALGTSSQWPPPGSVGRAVRGRRCPASSFSHWASGGVDREVRGWKEEEITGLPAPTGTPASGLGAGLPCLYVQLFRECVPVPRLYVRGGSCGPACVYFLCAF